MEEAIKRNNNIWIFNSGNIFNGNPKWLFVYINKYRKDIEAYWFCDDIKTVKYVKKLGYKAYSYRSKKGWNIQNKAGVFVVNQVKESIPMRMKDVKILNLWHGVGCKSIERKVDFGFLNEKIAAKYIKYNQTYKNNQLFLVTSPLMEKHFKEQCGIDDDKVIRAGYPCCMYKDEIKTFNHDILKQKGLSSNAKIAIYSPTYRDACAENFFGKAIPDIELLIKKLKEKNMLLIFKLHPLMENDYEYNILKRKYKHCNNLLFWDNKNDIYEIFDKIDLAIVDYSSIFYDMLAAGVKNFIRYIFDYDNKNNVRDFVFDYKKMTFGKVCNSFTELIDAFDNYIEKNDENRKNIYNLFWSYTKEDSFEEIINKTLEFKPQHRELPKLYSFDIFDTLIERKTVSPFGTFACVREMMIQSKLNFPQYFINDFINIRREAEANVREYYKKSIDIRGNNRLEITFDEIYVRIAELHNLNSNQIEFLKKSELEAEYDNCIPKKDMIAKVKELVKNNEKVVLISDMYLSKEIIRKILEKAAPFLAELPLYLSSDYGVQKTTKQLYLQVYKELDYNFKEWIHYGDNKFADGEKAQEINIKPVLHEVPIFNGYENSLVNNIKTYDSYLVAGLMAKHRTQHKNDEIENYSFAYVSLYWVPYVSWAIKHAISKGVETLYFISRDGYHLKRIADAIIQIKKLSIKTKYIYGSRKAWRIPSFIEKVDDEFFGPFGNFAKIKTFDGLLKAMDIDEEEFKKILPELMFLKNKKIFNDEIRKSIVSTLQLSQKYKKYLLEQAKKEREIINKYLLQEINFDEKFAFVEYWGRGYTQDCLTRLLDNASGKKNDNIFYYARSIYGTEGQNIRYNYTTSTNSLIFIEALFANLPYESVTGYEEKDNKVIPIIRKRNNDMKLHTALEKNLVKFCREFYTMNFKDENSIERELYRFALKYYKGTQTDRYIVSNLAHLKDSVELYGREGEFAPAITWRVITNRIFKGEYFGPTTKSMTMSLERSNKLISMFYKYKKSQLDRNPKIEKMKMILIKIKSKLLK